MPELNSTPAGEVILALQNRINDLEATIRSAQEERKAAPPISRKDLDDQIALLKAEIAELKAEKKAVKTQESKSKKEETTVAEESIETGLRSLSIFHE